MDHDEFGVGTVEFASPARRAGLGFVGIFGLLSALSASALLLYFLTCYLRSLFSKSKDHEAGGLVKFINSTLGRYLIHLFLCDFLQGLAFAVNLSWASQGRIHEGGACTLQGSLMQAGDMGTAFWSLLIAFQTFCLLFVQITPHPLIEPCATGIIWSAIIILPILGSTAFQDGGKTKAFWSLAGAWCWIGEDYQIHRLFDLYIWIFLTLFCCFWMYSLIYLKFVGAIEYIYGLPFRVHFRVDKGQGLSTCQRTYPYTLRQRPALTSTATQMARQSYPSDSPRFTHSTNDDLVRVARRLMWYPLMYAIVIIPAAICRMGDLAGWKPPFGLFIFGGIFCASSGLSNTLLFLFTRHSFIQRRARSQIHSVRQVDTCIDITRIPGPDILDITALHASKEVAFSMEEGREALPHQKRQEL